MNTILFFDADKSLKEIAEEHSIEDCRYIFFDEMINEIEAVNLEPYHDVEIISLFAHVPLVDNKKLDLFPKLKLINTRSTGFNHIDLDYCARRKITVTNVPRYGEATVAEFAFGLLLALVRKIILAKNDMAQNRVEMEKYVGFDLYGKTIGIIGTGAIGRHAIKIAQGFGMNVIAYDAYPSPELQPLYVERLETLLQRADIISLHVPSTPQTRHILDKAAFEQMKPGMIIINTARGDLIDTQALYDALRDGRIAGAGLDVLENEDFLMSDEAVTHDRMSQEFLLDSALNLKLLQFKNVIATPHIAFNSVDAVSRINTTVFETIKAFIGGNLINVVK